MKVFQNIRRILFLTAIISLAAGCSKHYLTEYNPSNRTTDTYYTTAAGYEDLVRSCYTLLRDISQSRTLVLNGTDLFVGSSWNPINYNVSGATGDPLDEYDVRLNSSLGDIQTLWDLLYREINRCNTVVSRENNIPDMSDSLKAVRMGEAKFLRSLCLFWAVQQWGDIPMPLTETTSATQVVTKAASKDVYTQLVKDLTQCVNDLPQTQTDYGRVTKDAAKFLLAKVYLTRGWNFANSLGGTPADFTSALQLCDDIITSGRHPLDPDYTKLWPQHNKNPLLETNTAASSVANNKDKEVIFSVQYNSNVLTYLGDPSVGTALQGNDLHSVFGGDPGSCPGAVSRSGLYNRFQPVSQATPAVYRLYDPQHDVRYKWNFLNYIVALQAVNSFKPSPGTNPSLTVSFAKGDTVVLYRPWNDPAVAASDFGVDVTGGTHKYTVVNTPQYNSVEPPGVTAPYGSSYPALFKFWQPGIQYGDGYGTANDALFRCAEVYLMAAEAIVKGATGAKLGTADVYYNAVLDRALGANAGMSPLCAANPGNVNDMTTVSYRATPSNITIDMILDEGARELLGEYTGRWYDLKRTGTLIDRTKKYNPWTKFSNTIADKFYLRPIPQGEIDNSNPKVEQNPGY
ncbi:MAG TPA: RagB/SusD family nutrient uptake outer membrane protein [Puia sp.]|nr:RagB/SusD family nutrient uptake outer membrane protein [Puia sp.]